MDIYRKVIRFLKRDLPSDYPVSIRRLPLNDDLDGYCRFKNDRFLIKINRNLLEHEAIETVLHEYAHVLAWSRCPYDEHCDQWGKAYSRVYRAFLKEFIDVKS